MMPFSPQRLAFGLGGRVLQAGKPRRFEGVGVDSRSLAPGELFVALSGRRAGEAFFGAALQAGAGALAGRSFSARVRGTAKRRGAWLIRVADGLQALQALARDQRRLLGCPVVAVTGSNGKTGVKDLLAHLLGEGVLATRGNYNNHIGVPLTLLRAHPGLRYAVLEAGMNHAGELTQLGRLIRPDLSLELNVGDAHAGNFADGRAGVAQAKEELLRAMGPSGIAAVNFDDPATRAMGSRFGGRVVSFGRGRGAHLRLQVLADRGARGLRARAHWAAPLGGRAAAFEVRLAQGGPARASQAAAALAAALALGAEPRRLAARLADWRPAGKLRQELRPLPGGGRAILDAYNASPQSMQAALDFLALSAPRGRRLAVLGCMLELGAAAPALHRALGRAARRAGLRALAALGEQAGDIVRGFGGEARAFRREEAAQAAAWMQARLRRGDWCLFKGSRGLAVERVHQAMEGA